MQKAGINGIACYLPERKITNEDFAKMFPNWNVPRAEQITGIKERRIEEANVPASEMAVRAALKLFETINANRSSVDFVIVVTQSGDYRSPATACLLQNRLGLPRSTGAMDINQGCSGYMYGLATAKALAESCIAQKILLITVEKTSFFVHQADPTMRLLQGDAATATLITCDDATMGIGVTDFGTDGSGFENIIVPYSGSAETMEREKDTAGARYAHPECVNMKGLEIFNFSVSSVPETINAALGKNGMKQSDIDYFVFHQANKIIITTIAEKMNIPLDKIPMNLERVGNTSCCSVPLLLSEIYNEKMPQPGSNILLCGFGVGLSWASTVLTVR
jgi:3-oxoacyl-[acyl-carrier-protein] synthase-3